MKRSKAFFVATIKNNRKRMLATFEQAKKHTKQLLENNSQIRKNISSLRENDILKKFVDFLEARLSKITGILPDFTGTTFGTESRFSLHSLRLVIKRIYTSGIMQLGVFSLKDAKVVAFIQSIPKNIRCFASKTYSRLVIRGEYTKRSLIILFVLAFSFGIAIKAIAVQSVTIGFEDYTLAPHGTLYDINLLQQKIIDRGDALSRNSLPEGGVCQEAE